MTPTKLLQTFLVRQRLFRFLPGLIVLNFFSVDTNLIQLDTDDLATNTNTYADNDDDLIFEVKYFLIIHIKEQ